MDLLTPQGSPQNPQFILETKLVEEIRNIGINKNETTSRKEAILRATIILRTSRNHKVVYTHSTVAINSFSIIRQNYYSDLIAEDYAKREALRLLANKISLLISAYLDKPHEN